MNRSPRPDATSLPTSNGIARKKGQVTIDDAVEDEATIRSPSFRRRSLTCSPLKTGTTQQTPPSQSGRRSLLMLHKAKSIRRLGFNNLFDVQHSPGSEAGAESTNNTVASLSASSLHDCRGDSKETAIEHIQETILELIKRVQSTERIMEKTKLLCQERDEGGTKLAAALAQTQLKNQQAKLDQISHSIGRLNRLATQVDNSLDDFAYDNYKDRVEAIVNSKPKRFSLSHEMSISDLSQSLRQLLVDDTNEAKHGAPKQRLTERLEI